MCWVRSWRYGWLHAFCFSWSPSRGCICLNPTPGTKGLHWCRIQRGPNQMNPLPITQATFFLERWSVPRIWLTSQVNSCRQGAPAKSWRLIWQEPFWPGVGIRALHVWCFGARCTFCWESPWDQPTSGVRRMGMPVVYLPLLDTPPPVSSYICPVNNKRERVALAWT